MQQVKTKHKICLSKLKTHLTLIREITLRK